MGPIILYSVGGGAGFISLIAFMLRESQMQRRANRFALVYNQAARAQWARFRLAHPENDCAPAIGRTGTMVRSLLAEASGTALPKLWARSWGKDAEALVLAKFYDDATYTARELRSAARRTEKVAPRRGVHITVSVVGV